MNTLQQEHTQEKGKNTNHIKELSSSKEVDTVTMARLSGNTILFPNNQKMYSNNKRQKLMLHPRLRVFYGKEYFNSQN